MNDVQISTSVQQITVAVVLMPNALTLQAASHVTVYLDTQEMEEHAAVSHTRKLSYRKDDRAMRPIYGCPENFQESLSTPTATFTEIVMF